MIQRIVFLLLFVSPFVFSATDDSINLLVRSSSTSQTRRYCIELAKLPNGRVVNVTEFGWYKPFLASTSVNACNITDLQLSLPSSFPPKTMLIISEHNCKMTEHAWNVEKTFGSNQTLMILTNRTNTAYSLTYNTTTMPVTISTLIFWNEDFHRLENFYKNLSDVEFSIDFPPVTVKKFRPATLLMFLLVFFVLLGGNFWGADEFRRRIKTPLPATNPFTAVPNSSSSDTESNLSQIVTKQNSVKPIDDTHQEDPAIIPMTYCVIGFILLFAVGWILLIYYFPKVMIYVLQVMFCIGAFSSFTNCLDRLSQFVPILRRYRIPSCQTRRPCVCKIGPVNISTLVFMSIALTLVLIWYFYRRTEWAWVLQDILGVAVCLTVMSVYRLGNMRVITLILLGFFLYDIFFVFITPYIPIFQPSTTPSTSTVPPTNSSSSTTTSPVRTPSRVPSVMEQVALGFGTNDEVVPLLFVLPLFIPDSEIDPCISNRKSMLGFGDVILPGILLTFCKIFDIASGNRWPVYYIQAIISYFIGLILTHVALILMNTAQPALLYLVPCILLSTILTGLYRKELKELYTGERIRLLLGEKTRRASSRLLHGNDNPQSVRDDVHNTETIVAVNENNNNTDTH